MHNLNNQAIVNFKLSLFFQFSFRVTGMGIPQGVTLIVGGGFHGKSTLLNSIQVGIYNHIPGDGREFVCTDPSAFAVRAEDGKCDN